MDVEYHGLETAPPNPNRVIVLYGQIGSRKTTTACSLIKEKGVLVCADGSWETLIEKPIHQDLVAKTDLVIYDSLSQLKAIDYYKYDTSILDPVSAMVDHFLDLVFDHAKWAAGFREKLITQHPELKNSSTTHPIDYKYTRDRFRPVLGHVFSQPSNIILTSHVNEPTKGLSTDTRLKPSIPNKTWEIIGRRATVVGYIEPKPRGDGMTINLDEKSPYCVGKSRLDGIEGKMDLDEFILKCREKL